MCVSLIYFHRYISILLLHLVGFFGMYGMFVYEGMYIFMVCFQILKFYLTDLTHLLCSHFVQVFSHKSAFAVLANEDEDANSSHDEED